MCGYGVLPRLCSWAHTLKNAIAKHILQKRRASSPCGKRSLSAAFRFLLSNARVDSVCTMHGYSEKSSRSCAVDVQLATNYTRLNHFITPASRRESSHCLDSKELHIRITVLGEHGKNGKDLLRDYRTAQAGG
jgi:hypothetical protein